MKVGGRKWALRVGRFLLVAVFVVFAAFPFAWMGVTAFKQDSDLYNPQNNPFWFNEPPTLAHLHYAFTKTQFARWVVNTALVGLGVVAITLLLTVPAAYSLARLLGRWGERASIGIFLVYLVPPTLLFIPMSLVVTTLGLQNTLWSLVVVYPTITVPLCTWLLAGFLRGLPRELEEAAMVDGCTRLGALGRVLLPLAVPGIVTVVIFSFTLSAQEFVYAASFVTATAEKTVSVGVPADMVRGDIFDWGPLMASAFLASVPVAALYYLVIERFVGSFTLSGAFR